jgi:hypothetical protein
MNLIARSSRLKSLRANATDDSADLPQATLALGSIDSSCVLERSRTINGRCSEAGTCIGPRGLDSEPAHRDWYDTEPLASQVTSQWNL